VYWHAMSMTHRSSAAEQTDLPEKDMTKLNGFIATALIAVCTAVCVSFQAMGAIEAAAVSDTGTETAETPATPRELLLSIRSALANEEIAKETFFDTATLKQFLGAGYHFSDYVGVQKGIVASDIGNVYFDEQGNRTWLGQHRPCLINATFEFTADGLNRKPQGSVAMLTIGRSGGPDSAISAELVKQIFGEPQEVTEGHPTAPPPHGYPYIESTPTNASGNSWLTYRTTSPSLVQYARFLTVADGTVTEIQLYQQAR
jgi:hypothetical protein